MRFTTQKTDCAETVRINVVDRKNFNHHYLPGNASGYRFGTYLSEEIFLFLNSDTPPNGFPAILATDFPFT
jgi:hypothetical protein